MSGERPPSRGSVATSHSAGEISDGSFDGFRSIRIHGLPLRSTDSSIRDGLRFEYKKVGRVLGVSIFGEGPDRYAILTFSEQGEAEKALTTSQEKVFFGSTIIVKPSEEDAELDSVREPSATGSGPPPREHRGSEEEVTHVKAPRTLFVGNIDREIGPEMIKDIFKEFGDIKGLDYKIQRTGTGPAYAFVHYVNSQSVHQAMAEMDGARIGNLRVKLGYGKAQLTNCVWLDGVASTVTEDHLVEMFSFYGPVTKCIVNTIRKQALVYFEKTECAQLAVQKMTGRTVAGKKIQIDFASKEVQASFLESPEHEGQGSDKLDYYERGPPPRSYSPPEYIEKSTYRRQRSVSEDGDSPRSSPYARRPPSPDRDPSPVYVRPKVKRRPPSPGSPPAGYRRQGSPMSDSRSLSPRRASSPGSSRRGASRGATPGSPRRSPRQGTSGEHHGLCIHNLPLRSTDTAIRDGLMFSYKKNGRISNVKVFGKGEDRFAVVTFKKSEDAVKALTGSKEKVFFGTKVLVTTHEGFLEPGDLDDEEELMNETHPKATKTLFVGNLEKEIDNDVLRDIFQEYGEIIDVEMKRHIGGTSFAFIQYTDISSVVRALHKMEGASIGSSKLKLGFGKSVPTTAVWVGCLAPVTTRKVLFGVFGQFGHITHCLHDRQRLEALVFYENIENAQAAVNGMRGKTIQGNRLHIDFASKQCQMSFVDAMQQTGQIKSTEEKVVPRPAFKPDFVNKYEYTPHAPPVKRGGYTTYPPRGRGRGVPRGRGRMTDYSNYRSGAPAPYMEAPEDEEDEYFEEPYYPPERPMRGKPYTRPPATARYEEFKVRRKVPAMPDSFERELEDYMRVPRKMRRVSVSPEPGPYRKYRGHPGQPPVSPGYDSPPRYERARSQSSRLSDHDMDRYSDKYRYKKDPESPGPSYEKVRVPRGPSMEARLPKAYAEERLPKAYASKVPKTYRVSPVEERPVKVYKRYITPSPPPPGPSKSRQADYPGYRIKRKSYSSQEAVEEKRPRRPPSPAYSDNSDYSKTPTPPPVGSTDDF